MNSGIEFSKQVIVPGKRGSDPVKVSFDTLSVSGRILNAYNALLLAEKMTTK